MKKIISLFKRNYETDRLVRDEVTPGAEWVIAGEGVPTRKHDGTCCMIRSGLLYKRYEVRNGKKPPHNFEPSTEIDAVTGKQQGWVPVEGGPEDKYHIEAFTGRELDGTYELCGPKIQGNPEGYQSSVLVPHGSVPLLNVPRDFEGLKKFLGESAIEGIVWHHPDGRMVKIKAKDFGIRRREA